MKGEIMKGETMKVILGTMTFSDQVDEPGTREMLRVFSEAGNSELDTAYQYQDGETEKLLGNILADGTAEDFILATKVNPWDGDGLKPDEVRRQFSESLERLQMDSVDLLYLHGPDLDTPVTETLEVCWELFQQGRFKRFGLSNFASWQVAEAVEICRHKGWMVPAVYQGLYNALNRDVERELLPCLRNYGISFNAYNPLAGGMLTGKHRDFSQAPPSGRFEGNESYQDRYWKQDYFDALDLFVDACRENSIRPSDAALRWLVQHSHMSAQCGDGIILGASKIDHLKQNMAGSADEALPGNIVEALDHGWERVRPDCFKYFRP
jgi:aflatoxin B1 aldehyde reductase